MIDSKINSVSNITNTPINETLEGPSGVDDAEDGGAEDGGAEDGGAEDGGAEDGGAESSSIVEPQPLYTPGNVNQIITNLENLKESVDSSLGGLAEDDSITDPREQQNAYSEIVNTIDIVKANSCFEDNCQLSTKTTK